MAKDSKTYNFPGGTCPACEHTPLSVEVSTNEYGASFVWFVCPACGNREQLREIKNADNSSRNSKLQLEWARRVKDRDGGACVICGSTDGLDAHHLISASDYPQLQTRIGNGVTLCRRCHKLTHNYTHKWPEKYK